MKKKRRSDDKAKKRNYPHWMLQDHLERLREDWLDDVAPGVYYGPIGKLHKYSRTINEEEYNKWR